MQRRADDAGKCGSVLGSLMAWAGRHPAIPFESAVRFLSEHGLRVTEAYDVIRIAIDRRLLIAKTPLGEIRNQTLIFPAALRRGATTEHDVTRTLGDATHRRRGPDGSATCLWMLAEGEVERPTVRWSETHRERDERIATAHGRSHVPFGPIFIGEHLLLRCRFGPDGILRSHRVEVR